MDMVDCIATIEQDIIAGKTISFDDARQLMALSDTAVLRRFFQAATTIREHFHGKRVDLCSITNAKSGNCSENCAFCAQSRHHKTAVSVYGLASVDEMVERAQKAFAQGADRFCIVTSGCMVTQEECDAICEAIRRIKRVCPGMHMDASLGALTRERARQLKEAGLDRYNHNIETAESFFDTMCTTHQFRDRLETLDILKEVGIERCCGGIIGLGESDDDRLRLAFTLRELDVDCVPLNFLNPIPGTPLENATIPSPMELLKIIALFRFVLPTKQIRICGGRQQNLRQLQSHIFHAGANAIILGDYLTTPGGQPHHDLQMIADLGLEVSRKQ